ncbi:sensor histidine kinase [Paenibacillus guangzhouensis]|uniref:sensor histidine kinase n=1 Tax=Paenibacillus guangzhouensis TaxID=1473112 RepID=UPI001267691A|nr:HAMP domain-containing sensor histidine kinase [Paenibacillus guangzhouensis]
MNHKLKLSGMLLRNYILFSLTVSVSVFMLLLFFVMRTNEWLPAKDTSMWQASGMVQGNTAHINENAIKDLHGWVEILDERLRVIEVKGLKQAGDTSYTEHSLNMLFYDTPENPYYNSIAPYRTDEGAQRYVLVRLPKRNVQIDIALDEETSKSNQVIFWGALAETGVLFLVLLGISVFIYSHQTAARLTSPLSKIAAGIRNITGGRYYDRLHLESNYELAQVQESFNAMAEKLDQAERENRLLAESKQRMLVDISHDLKTPITTIQGYAKALQLGMIEEEPKRHRAITLIHDKAQHVAELIDDVFELSKLESPDYPIDTEVGDVAEFMREMAVDYYDQFEEKRLRFECEIPPQEVVAPFNRKLMYRAISNLLTNALKYNPSGTLVQLVLVDCHDTVRIEVADNGVGIPDHLRERVFEAFVRGDEARRSDGGTGLGLSIANQIAAKHGGQLALDVLEGWTRFEITFPKCIGSS